MFNKSKTGLFALGFFVVSSIFIVIAFVSPYWLVTDGKLKNPKFIKIGMLMLFNCFANNCLMHTMTITIRTILNLSRFIWYPMGYNLIIWVFSGLWEVCFNGFEEVHHWYDTIFTGCWWIFEEEYYIIHDILLPGFFIATQFFFTITMCCVLISMFLTFIYLKKEKDDENYVTLLVTLGTILVIGGRL